MSGEHADQGDPQPDEDQAVKRARAELVGTEAVVARWLRYARSEECHARLMRETFEQQPFDRLRDTRAQVRRAAAELLERSESHEQAAREMMERVRQLYILEPPILGFDEAMITYTQARTWQACALELFPDWEQLQPCWK